MRNSLVVKFSICLNRRVLIMERLSIPLNLSYYIRKKRTDIRCSFTVLLISFRKSFLLGGLHRRSKFTNIRHDKCKTICRTYLCTKRFFLVIVLFVFK